MEKVSEGLGVLFVLLSAQGFAGVDKVYNPYVELGEIELELRGIHDTSGDFHKTKVGLGYGVTSNWFVEGYIIGEKEDGDFEVAEYELENKFQLSEQGEYWADLGFLVELEKKREDDIWEIKTGPIVQKRFGDIETTANLWFEKQFGDDRSEDEVETLGAFQVKYRLGETFEPAVEYYVDEETQAIGPVFLGTKNVFSSELKWEFGVLFALNDDTEDSIIRWQMEWEF